MAEIGDLRNARTMDACPRCNSGTLIKFGDGVSCLACGFEGWPNPQALALREQLREQPGRRLPRRAKYL